MKYFSLSESKAKGGWGNKTDPLNYLGHPVPLFEWEIKFQWSLLFHSLFWNQTLYSNDALRTVATKLTVSSSKRKKHPQFEVHQLGLEPTLMH